VALNHDGSLLWQADTVFSFPTGEADLRRSPTSTTMGRSRCLRSATTGTHPGSFEVLNGIDGSLKWEYPSDGSLLNVGSVSPTVFDLDGDGNTEVLLFGDQPRTLWVLDGETGSLIQEVDLGLGNAPQFETPVFADVDN
jgi:hypothetical protein